MGSLKEVRNRIVSVNSTKQITAAMKMVSAAKLRRAQDAIVRMRPYAEKLPKSCSNVSASLDGSESKYSRAARGEESAAGGHCEQPRLGRRLQHASVPPSGKGPARSCGRRQELRVLPIGKKAMDLTAAAPCTMPPYPIPVHRCTMASASTK
jgi:hypothetical protein